jgi:uncharacterized RDD family membrane protein YckC
MRYVFCSIWVLPPLAWSQSAHLARWEIAAVFFGWVACWALLSFLQPQRQFWHDIWAGTRLVEAPRLPAGGGSDTISA